MTRTDYNEARFERQYAVDLVTECWNWLGGKYASGYGRKRAAGKESSTAHRYSYERHVGPIPDGLQIDHLCFNRACVNPAHLEAVTAVENSHRRRKGMVLTDEQVAAVRAAAGSQRGIAARFGISRGFVRDIQSGHSRAVITEASSCVLPGRKTHD
jgi:hypothetical protein